MAGAGGDVPAAAGAHVRLGRLVGLHPAYLDLEAVDIGVEPGHGGVGDVQPTTAQTTRPRQTASAAPTMT